MDKTGFTFRSLFFAIIIASTLTGCQQGRSKAKEVALKTGVSQKLAQYRKGILSDLHYQIHYDIPPVKEEPIKATTTIQFTYLDSLKTPLQIDFKQNGVASLHKMLINGIQTVPNYQKEHIIIDAGQLQKGANSISFEFRPGEEALNRRDDYMYTLFVPDRARTAFPCFDQPDLKAVFELSLVVDTSWQAIANGEIQDSLVNGSRKTLHFAPSDTLSTYLFAFTAGKFKWTEGKIKDLNAKLLYRETDPAKIKASLGAIYALSNKAIQFYEDWTGLRYPFHNLGMAAIPNFQFGGMEHPGSILYQSSSLFLDPVASTSQLNNRSNLLAHELAHMWFGDLVTMKWFNDVWMKEVFANFMADKCMRPPGESTNFNHKFLLDHYPAAYNEDRSAGATPIRQKLDNLQNAGMLYGNIIYHKAPIMMRQLELLAGETAFKKGVRSYLQKYAYGNAGWPALIELINQQTPVDLIKWNKVWVERAGRPVFNYQMETKAGRITKFSLHQQPEMVAGRDTTQVYNKDQSAVWPQIFDIALYYEKGVKVIGVRNGSAAMEVKAAIGQKAPLFILFNSNGMGYGLFPADSVMADHLDLIGSPLQRASAYINLYEQLLAGNGQQPQRLLECMLKAAHKEKDELNTRLLLGYIQTIYWNFIPKSAREAMLPRLEAALWAGINNSTTTNIRKLYFQAYCGIFQSKEAFGRLKRIWEEARPPKGVKLYEDDYTDLALVLALRMKENKTLLDSALSRISNEDKKATFEIVMQAASSDPAKRDQFFKEISDLKGRSNERAVLEGLAYLHHPLRQPQSEQYLAPSLKLLEEIQNTGTIFFPKSYLSAIFSHYNNKAALDIVNAYLDKHHGDFPKLTDKLLQATDLLRRAQKWTKKE